MTQTETFTVGEVNAKGRAALVEWLETNLAEPMHSEAWADDMIANLDGSFADVQGLMVELRGHKSRTGNPVIYRFGGDEYDLVTYDEDGGIVAPENGQSRLIAAAPDMLAALQQCETIVADHVAGVERTAWPEVLHSIRAAIAKATGEGEG